MQYHTANISLEGFFETLPLIVITIICCQKYVPLINQLDKNLNNSNTFRRDVFLLSYSFLLACLFSLILAYDNSDVRAWWPLIICMITLYGLLFSLIFSALALFIPAHKKYTIFVSFLIIILLSSGQFLPQYIPLPLLGNVETFFAITGLLIIFHGFFVAIMNKINNP